MAQNHHLFLCHLSHTENVEISLCILCNINNIEKTEYCRRQKGLHMKLLH